MVELMEPTDWVVRCETMNGGLALSPAACFMGIGLETCLDVFDYSRHSVGEVRKKFQQHPRVLRETDEFREEEIIGPAWHHFFRLHRLRGSREAEWSGNELMLAIILRGEGEIAAGKTASHCKQGETWLLPGAAESWQWRNSNADWELLLLRLPIPSATTTT